MVWAFQISLSRKLYKPDKEVAFQSNLYENIYLETTKAIILETHRPNCAMHDIHLGKQSAVYFLRRNDIDTDIVNFADTCGGLKCLFSFPFTAFYTHHKYSFLTVRQLLLPFGVYNAFQGYWNHVAMILLVAEISIFLFGIEELVVQLKITFFILPMQGFCK